jgi:ketosteroid isomerase-like protein
MTGVRVALLALPFVLFGVAGGCTFEHRGNDAGEVDTAEPGAGLAPTEGEVSPEAPVLDAVRTQREAVARGDLALALALLHPDATLVDALLSGAHSGATRGELLLELRALLGRGFRLDEEGADVTVTGETALVVSTLRLEGEDDASGQWLDRVGRVVHESTVLVLTPEGWRIRHMHRSLAPEL